MSLISVFTNMADKYLTLKVKLIILGVVLALTSFGIWRVYDIGGDRREKVVRAEWAKAEQDRKDELDKKKEEDQAATDDADRLAAERLSKTLKDNQVLKQRVANEIAKNRAAYRDCIVPDDGRLLYNEAVRAAGTH